MFNLVKLSNRELRGAFSCLIVFCIAYSYELTHFNLTIDDEVLAYSKSSAFTEVGRWLHPVIRETLWPQVISPAGPLILFGCAISIGFVYILKLLGVRRIGFFHYIVFAAFILFPAWVAQLEFSANVIAVGAGTLSAILAGLLTVKLDVSSSRKIVAALLAISLLCATAIAAYQSLILFYSVIVIAGLLQVNKDPALPAFTNLSRRLLLGVAALILSFILYLLISKFVMVLYGIEPSPYGLKFINPSDIVGKPFQVARFMAQDIYAIYFSFWRDFGLAGYVYSFSLICSMCVLLIEAKNQGRNLAFVASASLAIVILPAAISLITGGGLPLRTFMSASASLGCLFLLAYEASTQFFAKTAIVFMAILAAIQGLYINSIYQARGWVVQRHDLMLASAINSAVVQTGVDDGKSKFFADFQGIQSVQSIYPRVPWTTAGYSFFEWDGGVTSRIVRYMNMTGFDRYSALPEESKRNYLSIYKSMPAWPAEGSVKRMDGVVLIKLSE